MYCIFVFFSFLLIQEDLRIIVKVFRPQKNCVFLQIPIEPKEQVSRVTVKVFRPQNICIFVQTLNLSRKFRVLLWKCFIHKISVFFTNFNETLAGSFKNYCQIVSSTEDRYFFRQIPIEVSFEGYCQGIYSTKHLYFLQMWIERKQEVFRVIVKVFRLKKICFFYKFQLN